MKAPGSGGYATPYRGEALLKISEWIREIQSVQASLGALTLSESADQQVVANAVQSLAALEKTMDDCA